MREEEFMKQVAAFGMPDVPEVKAFCMEKLREERKRRHRRGWIAGTAVVAAMALCLCIASVNSLAKGFFITVQRVLVFQEDGGESGDFVGEPFNFNVSVGNEGMSGEVQKKASGDYATVSVAAYGNTTDKECLYIRVLRDGVAVTDSCKVDGRGKYVLNYTSDIYAGQYLTLCAYTGDDVSYGYGVLSGVFDP